MRSTEMTPKQQTGFSLVELMVALTLSLILIGGVLTLVYSSKVTYLENERVAGTQEGGRAAFEMILRDLRGSGFSGCARPVAGLVSSVNRLTGSASLLWALDVPLQGYEGTSGTFAPALDPVLTGAMPPPSTKNDIIVVRTMRAGLPQMRTSILANPGDAVITVAKSVGQRAVSGTFVISDCVNQRFFAATATDNGATATLTKTAAPAVPSNQSTDLQALFAVGSVVTPVDTVIYYIAPSATTTAVQAGVPVAAPALWRIVSSNGAQPEELIPGVERMELQYGVDTDENGTVDEYDDANTVDVAGNWGNVVSVRVAILVRSLQANSPEVDSKKYTLLNTTLPAFMDHYERSVYTTTITLRNNTP